MNTRCFGLWLSVFIGVHALFFASVLPAQASVDIRSGHAGHWYAPARDGEGWVLELRDAGDAWLYWFTYDADGGQRWLTAHGQIVADGDGGERIDFSQLVVTRGARFGDGFDPDDVVHEAVGSASLRFDDCDSGEFSYNAFDQTQSIPVQRLAGVMGTRCETPHGVTGREVAGHAGQSGSWYDPTHAGEGFALHWAAPSQAIVTWYSYDAEGNQYWMLGVGQLDDEGRIHFPDVHATRGARFGSAFDPDDVERFEWGTLTFELACEGGSADYQSVLPAFGSGRFDLGRLTRLDEVACPWARPALADLYAIELVELPTAVDGVDDAVRLVGSVNLTDDATLWSIVQLEETTQNLRVARLSEGDEAWSLIGDVVVPNPRQAPGLLVRGSQVFANALDDQGNIGIVVWEDDDWRPLIDGAESPMRIGGVSADGGLVVGNHLTATGQFAMPWIRDAGQGVVELPVSAGMGLQVPLFASSDSSRLFGTLALPRPDVASSAAYLISWPEQGGPSVVVASDGWRLAAPGACADDCGVLFGAVASRPPPIFAPPDVRHEPWYWRTDGRSGVLGTFSARPGARYIVSGASDDGNTVVGAGGSFLSFSTGAGALDHKTDQADVLRVDGFIWMPDVGMTAVSELLSDTGLSWSPLENLYASAISPDGRRIFLQGQLPETATSNPRGLVMARLALTLREPW